MIRRTRFDYRGLKIYKKISYNPRRKGTKAFNNWAYIRDGMTYEEFCEAGGESKYLRYDWERGKVELRLGDEVVSCPFGYRV